MTNVSSEKKTNNKDLFPSKQTYILKGDSIKMIIEEESKCCYSLIYNKQKKHIEVINDALDIVESLTSSCRN